MGKQSRQKRERKAARAVAETRSPAVSPEWVDPTPGIITLPSGSLDAPPGPTLVEKKVRLTFEFDVLVNDIDPAGARRHFEQTCRSRGREDALEVTEDITFAAEAQRQLLHAVLARPETFLRYVRQGILADALEGDGLLAPLQKAHGDELDSEFEEILEPALSELPSEVKEHFRDAAERGLMGEHIELLDHSIKLSGAKVSFSEAVQASGT